MVCQNVLIDISININRTKSITVTNSEHTVGITFSGCENPYKAGPTGWQKHFSPCQTSVSKIGFEMFFYFDC